jgi:uncharacterized membrane protein YfcA
MTANHIVILLFIGVAAGALSGMFGIGGAIFIVPALVYFLGFNQLKAQGTTLFIFLLPVGFLGAINYYKAGNLDIKTALVICSTFVFGSYFGSKFIMQFKDQQDIIKKIFGVIIMIISLKMLFEKSNSKKNAETTKSNNSESVK